ncbi:MAG: NAD+ synthase [Thiobacillaceae bacterium]|nr:NAD+ synthase [Thiobacillaceae bacterium]MDW8323775.1 NAD+ synthase [Burkholderiales bacterium]
MKLALAQLNPTVGDLAGNAARIIDAARQARLAGADLLLAPELALCGYPPEDLALREDFYAENARVLAGLARNLPAGLTVVFGLPLNEAGLHYNAAVVLRDGRTLATHRKQRLPNHSVFDELRTFVPGEQATVFDCAGVRCGLLICEDLWHPEPVAQARAAGAELLLVINASPFHRGKQAERYAVARARIGETGLPLVYLNTVGGQDELVFDGGSFAMDGRGAVTAQLPMFTEGLHVLEYGAGAARGECHPLPDELDSVYAALTLGVRDYVEKNRFPGVLLGLSGGIDSALTLVIAVDALGPQRVEAVMMPSQYTSDISREDAQALAQRLGVAYRVIPIKSVFDSMLTALADCFEGLPYDVTEENIQARIRGMLLMALSNKFGRLVLTTGNKSELATGYATLYGDMAGGFAVLKDVAKTLVYQLACRRNQRAPVIPERVIVRAPSAELRPNQTDQDTLPPYEDLDAIMQRYLELDQSPREIVAAGYPEEVVRRVVRMIDAAEYKRRQSAPGIRVTRRAFGRDRRYPITNRYQPPF